MIELSVIIPTCNRPVLLNKALASLVCQGLSQSRFEVIVVDNAPSDETAEVTNSFYGSIVNLRYLREESPGLHNARHRGMREANSEFLVYCDDDIEAFPCWLEGVLKGFNCYDAVLVGGRNLPKWEIEPPRWLNKLWTQRINGMQSIGYLSIFDYVDEVRDIDPLKIWGCNFSIRKSALLEAGGFHPDSMPEHLLSLRGDGETSVSSFLKLKGYRSLYMPSATVYHYVPRTRMTVDYFRHRAFCQGISESYSQLRDNPEVNESTIAGSVHPLRKYMDITLFRKVLEYILPGNVYLRANINEAYWSGFKWHFNSFQQDDFIRSWVLRETYFN